MARKFGDSHWREDLQKPLNKPIQNLPIYLLFPEIKMAIIQMKLAIRLLQEIARNEVLYFILHYFVSFQH